jgi:hypothetical protein
MLRIISGLFLCMSFVLGPPKRSGLKSCITRMTCKLLFLLILGLLMRCKYSKRNITSAFLRILSWSSVRILIGSLLLCIRTQSLGQNTRIN